MNDITRTISLDYLSASQLKTLLGEYNNHLKYIQKRLDVKISQCKSTFILSGNLNGVDRADLALEKLSEEAQINKDITPEELHLIIQSSMARNPEELADNHESKLENTESTKKQQKKVKKSKKFKKPKQSEVHEEPFNDYNPITLKTRKGKIIPRGPNQQKYVQKILSSDVSFGVGPAGTGKTYLAVACAVDMLERNEIERILLVRPAVEAGEKLGFLPGDLTQKIDPYLRPLYDALHEMLGAEKVAKLLERQIIEIAPLAYMRGRTLNNSFVILDEAQNTTPEQMKMFLTRLGFGSQAVITGDITQVDLPRGHKSGLSQAIQILGPIQEIHITRFDSKDVVRHQLVQKIVEAYDVFDIAETKRTEKKREQRR